MQASDAFAFATLTYGLLSRQFPTEQGFLQWWAQQNSLTPEQVQAKLELAKGEVENMLGRAYKSNT